MSFLQHMDLNLFALSKSDISEASSKVHILKNSFVPSGLNEVGLWSQMLLEHGISHSFLRKQVKSVQIQRLICG